MSVVFKLDDIVCLHGITIHGTLGVATPWMGVLTRCASDWNYGDVFYVELTVNLVRVSPFAYSEGELRETIMTFEGPKCIQCKVAF